MAVPYSTTSASILGNHTWITEGGVNRLTEEIHIKESGTWRKTKEVWIKESGTWRLVHEGEHFLFQANLNSPSQDEFVLSTWLNGQGYSSGPIKGVIHVTQPRKRVNMGNFSGKVYLWNSGAPIKGSGGNGGNRGGQNGAVGMDAVYSGGTPFLLNNQGGVIAGGGGGGGGGSNAQCVYQNTYTYGCMKGNQCSDTDQQFSNANGGGGGGGAGYPGGQGKDGGQNGQETGGGGGGGNAGCGSNSGGSGGNLGQSGQNVTGGSGGSNGKAIVGYNHKISDIGSGNGDLRGGTSNT